MENIVIIDTNFLEIWKDKKVLGIRTKLISKFTGSNKFKTFITEGIYKEILKHQNKKDVFTDFLSNITIKDSIPCNIDDELQEILNEVRSTDFYIASTTICLSSEWNVIVLTKNIKHIKKVMDKFTSKGLPSFQIIDSLQNDLFIDLSDKKEKIIDFLEEAIEYHRLDDDFYHSDYSRVEDEAFGLNSLTEIFPLFYQFEDSIITNISFTRNYYKSIKDNNIEEDIIVNKELIRCFVTIDIDENFELLNIANVEYY